MIEKEQIIGAIKTVYDPEIPVDIWEMGMIYDINISDDGMVKIVMTVTAPNCPVADTLPIDVKNAVTKVEGVSDAWVELTFNPPWTPELMSEVAKLELGML